MRLTADQKARVFAKYDVCANEAGDKYERVLCEFRESRLNLAICPSEP
jgi:NADH:ubiquinone oxidoreductase subunit D